MLSTAPSWNNIYQEWARASDSTELQRRRHVKETVNHQIFIRARVGYILLIRNVPSSQQQKMKGHILIVLAAICLASAADNCTFVASPCLNQINLTRADCWNCSRIRSLPSENDTLIFVSDNTSQSVEFHLTESVQFAAIHLSGVSLTVDSNITGSFALSLDVLRVDSSSTFSLGRLIRLHADILEGEGRVHAEGSLICTTDSCIWNIRTLNASHLHLPTPMNSNPALISTGVNSSWTVQMVYVDLAEASLSQPTTLDAIVMAQGSTLDVKEGFVGHQAKVCFHDVPINVTNGRVVLSVPAETLPLYEMTEEILENVTRVLKFSRQNEGFCTNVAAISVTVNDTVYQVNTTTNVLGLPLSLFGNCQKLLHWELSGTNQLTGQSVNVTKRKVPIVPVAYVHAAPNVSMWNVTHLPHKNSVNISWPLDIYCQVSPLVIIDEHTRISMEDLSYVLHYNTCGIFNYSVGYELANDVGSYPYTLYSPPTHSPLTVNVIPTLYDVNATAEFKQANREVDCGYCDCGVANFSLVLADATNSTYYSPSPKFEFDYVGDDVSYQVSYTCQVEGGGVKRTEGRVQRLATKSKWIGFGIGLAAFVGVGLAIVAIFKLKEKRKHERQPLLVQ
ncbi:hypothetical protein PROFUN_13916 [Planoprotostelium fungivorum]|uniref:Uncharacterized protein n=1 Tax=Planoprotostelium fungivorum TaxID=1890364 RepID=A0A2P6N2V9_9EUKA|nr:hypothetical protein PROFUN_13916 [Planoprotostelium fungivorum]